MTVVTDRTASGAIGIDQVSTCLVTIKPKGPNDNEILLNVSLVNYFVQIGMYDTTDPRPPLPEWITECYTFLCEQEMDEDSHSFPRERALDALLEAQALELDPQDASHALTRLLERGYLYEVDGELRVTTPIE